MKTILKHTLVFIAGLFLVAEEWFWTICAPYLARLANHPWVAALERRIQALKGYEALSAFLLPIFALFPFKFAALFVLARGHFILGGIVFILAKLLGGALAARIYQLTASELLKMAWFAKLHALFFRFRAYIYGILETLPAWLRLRQWVQDSKQAVRTWWQRGDKSALMKRWLAALRFKRRQKQAETES